MIDHRDGEIEGNAERLSPAKSAKGLGLQWVADSNIPADQLATSASFFFGKIDLPRNETICFKEFCTLLTPQFTFKIVNEWKSTYIYWWIGYK